MTSKERCEALMEYIVEANQGYFDKERIGNDLTAILIDLGDLEKMKKIMGTPIQDILNQLKELEIFKKWFMEKTVDYRTDLFVDTFIREDEPIFKILREWLENE